MRELAELLRQTSWSIRERAVAALAARADALGPTIAVVESGPWFAKASACDVLGRLGDAAAAACIARALLDRNVSVQKSAARAMESIAEKHGDAAPVRALAELTPAERRAAAARLTHQAPGLAVTLATSLARLAPSSPEETPAEDSGQEIAAIRRFRAWIGSHVPERERVR